MSTQIGVLNTPVEIVEMDIEKQRFFVFDYDCQRGCTKSVLTPLEDWDETLYKKDC